MKIPLIFGEKKSQMFVKHFIEISPERIVSLAETLQSQYNESDNSSECPDELYNLTKLAEVSLAAAAGKILDHRHLTAVTSPENKEEEQTYSYTHKLFDKSSRITRPHLLKVSTPHSYFPRFDEPPYSIYHILLSICFSLFYHHFTIVFRLWF